MTQRIIINGKEFTAGEITSDQVVPKTIFEKNLLTFCSAWLSGADHFKLTTSGSTSEPKEIVLSRQQMIESAKKTQAAIGLQEGWSSLVCLDPRFIAGQMMLVRSFVSNMHIYAVEPTRNPFQSIPNELKLDFAAFVPYQLQAILEAEPKRLNEMRAIVIGGAGVDTYLKEKLIHLRPDIYSTYGMTETVSHIALQKLNGSDAQNHFHTLPGITVKEDDRGCLIAKVDFLKEEVITNDLVECHSDSEFTWHGRWDNVINTGGYKVIPEKLERLIKSKLSETKHNKRFFITGLPHPDLGQQVTMIIEGSDSVETRHALEQIFETLSKYEIPKSIHFVREFCETESGKVDRNETLKLIPV
ncbi:MAG: AMP-binding protein [Cyclobacteriaceae bacterium]